MRVSSGFIIECYGRWLVAHVTNGTTWDFPKGGVDKGETHIEAAIREVMEETGFDIYPHIHRGIVDYGMHPYIKGKHLHLYGILVPEVDISLLECTTYVDRGTYNFPEVDDFMLIDPSKRENYLSNSMLRWVDTHVLRNKDFVSLSVTSF